MFKEKLIANGFLFKYEDSKKIQAFPWYKKNQNLASKSNASALFCGDYTGRDAGHFLLERNDNRPLQVPLEYTGNVASVPWGYQCQSQEITEFSSTIAHNDDQLKQHYMNEKKKLYCLSGDEECQRLYAFLKENGLFENPSEDDTSTNIQQAKRQEIINLMTLFLP